MIRGRSLRAHGERFHVARTSIYLVACITIIALGAVLRFTQLSTRALFIDEGYTQIRVAGATESELASRFYRGRPFDASVLRREGVVTDRSTAARTVASLASEDAQHPPLFYLIELGLVKTFGNALLVWRVFSAVCGIASIGAIFLLCRELYGDTRIACAAAALFAVSPVERIYSEEAREYSLLVLLTLVATWAVLRAVRARSSRSWWAVYCGLLIAGLYTSPFFAYVLAAHAVFVLGAYRRNLVRFGAAVLTAVVLYLPWLAILFMHRAQIAQENAWSGQRWPLVALAAKWLFNFGAVFFDMEYAYSIARLLLAVLFLLVLVALARGFVLSNNDARWLIGAGIAVPALVLIVPDLILAQHRSSVARYALPIFALVPLLVASGTRRVPYIFASIIAVCVVSSVAGSQRATWWDNDANAADKPVASVVNTQAARRPQVISSVPPAFLLGLAQNLRGDVSMSLAPDIASAQFAAHRPIYIVRPTPAQLTILQELTKRRPVVQPYADEMTAHERSTTTRGKSSTPVLFVLH